MTASTLPGWCCQCFRCILSKIMKLRMLLMDVIVISDRFSYDRIAMRHACAFSMSTSLSSGDGERM